MPEPTGLIPQTGRRLLLVIQICIVVWPFTLIELVELQAMIAINPLTRVFISTPFLIQDMRRRH